MSLLDINSSIAREWNNKKKIEFQMLGLFNLVFLVAMQCSQCHCGIKPWNPVNFNDFLHNISIVFSLLLSLATP